MGINELIITVFSLAIAGFLLLRTRLGQATFRRLRRNAPSTSPLRVGLILGASVFAAYALWALLLPGLVRARLPLAQASVLSLGVGAIAYLGCLRYDRTRRDES